MKWIADNIVWIMVAVLLVLLCLNGVECKISIGIHDSNDIAAGAAEGMKDED